MIYHDKSWNSSIWSRSDLYSLIWFREVALMHNSGESVHTIHLDWIWNRPLRLVHRKISLSIMDDQRGWSTFLAMYLNLQVDTHAFNKNKSVIEIAVEPMPCKAVLISICIDMSQCMSYLGSLSRSPLSYCHIYSVRTNGPTLCLWLWLPYVPIGPLSYRQ